MQKYDTVIARMFKNNLKSKFKNQTTFKQTDDL